LDLTFASGVSGSVGSECQIRFTWPGSAARMQTLGSVWLIFRKSPPAFCGVG
jgi:hypothetical protein